MFLHLSRSFLVTLIGMAAVAGFVAFAWSGTAAEGAPAGEAPADSQRADCTGRKELASSNDFLDPASATATWLRQHDAADRKKFGCSVYLDSLFSLYERASTGTQDDAQRSEALLQITILLDAGEVPKDNLGQVNWLETGARLLRAVNH